MNTPAAPLIFPLPGNETLAARLATALAAQLGTLAYRRFPDGESYVRLMDDVKDRNVLFLCTLNAPDDKTLALLFAARAARELGAARVGLVAPYLAYMRQDKRFAPGEALTSNQYATLLAQEFDWMVTADPHLHRHLSLSEIYPIATQVVHCAPLLSAWIKANVPQPWVVGPDEESEQWVAAVAQAAHAPYVTLRKTRHGDRDVDIALPDLAPWRGHTPVLVDDIISSGRTMAVACQRLIAADCIAPVCVGVHALFAGDAYEAMRTAGAARIVTTNSVVHPSNGMDVTPLLAQAVRGLVG